VRVPWVVFIALAACSPHAQSFVQGDGGEVVLLPYPADGGEVVWDGWAGGFVNDYCVQCHNPGGPCFGSGCHSPGDPRTPDFQEKPAVVALAPVIQCGVSVDQEPIWDCGSIAPETFPVSNGQNPMPTDEQRGLMVGWIEAGCP